MTQINESDNKSQTNKKRKRVYRVTADKRMTVQ